MEDRMPTYQIKFTDDKGFLLADDEFLAEHDEAACVVANMLFDACSELYANYVLLWRAGRRFKMVSKTGVNAALKTRARDILTGAQEVTLERERVLHDSSAAVARSRRFLDAYARLSSLTENGARPLPRPT
jgi:hypothetical protein